LEFFSKKLIDPVKYKKLLLTLSISYKGLTFPEIQQLVSFLSLLLSLFLIFGIVFFIVSAHESRYELYRVSIFAGRIKLKVMLKR